MENNTSGAMDLPYTLSRLSNFELEGLKQILKKLSADDWNKEYTMFGLVTELNEELDARKFDE